MSGLSIICPLPFWEDGRLSPCIQRTYAENFIPLGAIGISLLLFLLSGLSGIHSNKTEASGVFYRPSVNDAGQLQPEQASLHLTTTHRPFLTWVEGSLLLLHIFTFVPITLLLLPPGGLSIGLLCLAGYSFIVWLGLRLSQWQRKAKLSLHLNCQLGALYVVQLLCLSSRALSSINTPTGSRWDPVVLLQACLSTTVLLLHINAPKVSIGAPEAESGSALEKPTKEMTASLLSKWCFSWVGDIVWKALKTPLEITDLDPLPWNQRAAYLSDLFYNSAPVRFKLLWRLYQVTKFDLLRQGFWASIFSLMSFCPAMLLRGILAYMEPPDSMSRNNAWLCVGGLLVTGLITSVADCQCEWLGRKIMLKLRAILINEVFAKVLRRRVTDPTAPAEKQEGSEPVSETFASDGNVFNFMAVDATTISEFSAHTYLVWVNFPLQLTIASMVLYSILGISGILGVVLMIALLPLNLLISQRQVAAQTKVLTATDARVQASNELIKNIRTIKLCAWEAEFRDKVRGLRTKELSELRGNLFWWSISVTLFFSLPFITTILTLFIYTIIEKQSLETKIAFPALATFAILRIPLDRIASSISFIMQSLVSINRIERFLQERETDKYGQAAEGENSRIGFDNASFQWPSTSKPSLDDEQEQNSSGSLPRSNFQLANLEISFRKEGLNVIFGRSGCGKSSLLLALLGEMELLGGKVALPFPQREYGDPFASSSTQHGYSHMAYFPQEPWILNRSVRANILFGNPLNHGRYREVLDAVSLVRDLQGLEEGDGTLAGERGSRLSGGQKQRIALARAIYSDSKILILDDCLSTLDSRTEKSVFFQAIRGPLMKGRTCIFATHHTQLVLPHCEYGVWLANGRVQQQGDPSQLIAQGLTGASGAESKDKGLYVNETHDPLPMLSESASHLGADTVQSRDAQSSTEETLVADEPQYHELKSTGAVSWSVIKLYLLSMGNWWFWGLVMLGFIAQQLGALGTNLWIKTWAGEFDRLQDKSVNIMKDPGVDSVYYLAIYALIVAAYALASFIRDLTVFSGALRASSKMFDNLLDSILYAKLLFFDKVPFGQITNRFSKDVEAIDQEVAPHSMSTFYTFCSLATVMFLISSLLPVFLPVTIIICLIYYIITKLFVNSARDLNRIEAVRQSPLYQHFGETLSGAVSVRAYGHTERFTEENNRLIDGFNEPNAMRWASKEWLTLRIASLSAIISWLTGTFLLLGLDKGSVTPGVAGLALTYAATFTENVLWFVELYSIIQQNFNSVERVIEYTHITQEHPEPLGPEATSLSSDWPVRGYVRFRGYTTSYSLDLDPVLTELEIDIPAGQRVAIVGRTGAGKSSIALALIRVLEADIGSITIDGMSISSIPLKQLRQAVSVVPQDPALFDGTLRDNLDPFHTYPEAELYNILHTLQLFESLQVENLDHPAAALSQGQKQLVCIARALLRRSRVLVLDEATASIDQATDTLIQAALRSSITAGTTVITIAHRLSSIADYDKVVVLEAGRVVEQGPVAELLCRSGEDAFFRHLCEQSGDLDSIKAIARSQSI